MPATPGTGYLWSLVVDATNPLVLYGAGVSWKGTEFERFSLYRTTDGGASWTSLGYPPEDFVIFSGPLADPSDPTVIYTVGSGRLYVSRGYGGWEKAGSELPAITGLAASQKLPGYVFATTIDGIYRSTDTGRTWVKNSSIGLSDLPVSNLLIHPATGALYAWQSGLVKSTDQGANWVRRGGSVPGTFYGMTIDRLHPEIVYVSTSENLFKSTDEGASWTTGGRVVGRPVYNITADPHVPGRLYAFEDDRCESCQRRLIRLDGYGAERQVLWTTTESRTDRLRVDTQDPLLLYAWSQYGSRAEVSSDGGVKASKWR